MTDNTLQELTRIVLTGAVLFALLRFGEAAHQKVRSWTRSRPQRVKTPPAEDK